MRTKIARQQMAVRVAKRFLVAESTEDIDKAFSSWRGKNPFTGNEIGYWTLKGWLRISAKDKKRKNLKQHAEMMFNEFRKKLSEKSAEEVKKEVLANLSLKNFGLPKDIFGCPKFSFEIKEEPSLVDLDPLVASVRSSFKLTEEKGFFKKLLDKTIKSVSNTIGDTLVAIPKLAKSFSKNPTAKDLTRESPELRESAENLAIQYTEKYAVGFLGTKGVLYGLASGGAKAIAGTTVASGALASAPAVVATASCVVVTSLIKKHLIKNRAGGLLRRKEVDQLALDIFNGKMTPEKLEEEYQQKVDDLYKKYRGKELKEKLEEVYLEFQSEVLPAIEKENYLRARTEGSVFGDRFKRASGEKEKMPVLVSLALAIKQNHIQEEIEKYFKSEDCLKDFVALLKGEEEVPQEVFDLLQKKKGEGFLKELKNPQKKNPQKKKALALKVAKRVLVAISVSKEMDETFFSWRGENPISGGSIGYWTLKGWLRIPQADLERARLRNYAIQKFHDFEMRLKRNKKEEIKKDILEKIKEENFGLPNHLYKGSKFSFDLKEKLSPEDMKDLSNAIKDTFQTKGYNRSKIRQLAENSISTYTNHLLVAVPKLFGKAIQLKEEGVDLTGKDKITGDDDTEIKEEAENTILSYAESYATGILGAKGGLYAISSAALKVSTGVIASESLPVEAGLIAGALVATSLIKKAILSNRVGGLLHKEGFDQLVSDIYSGSQTPEDLENKYRKKVDTLMKEHEGDDLRTRLQDVYLEFQTEVLPRIEKGLYQRGENEGSVFDDRFRRASEGRNQMPVVLSMRFALAGFDLEDNIKSYFDSEKSAKDLQDLLSGKESVPSSVERFLQKGKVRGFLRDEMSFQKKKKKIEKNQDFSAKKKVFEIQKIDPLLFKAID